jgi:hypothetical protein
MMSATHALLVSLTRKVDAIADLCHSALASKFVTSTAPAAGNPASSPLPNWVNQHFKQKGHKLLSLLWGRGEVGLGDLHESLYGEVSEDRLDHVEALIRLKSRTNKRLTTIGAPFEIRTRWSHGVWVLQHIETTTVSEKMSTEMSEMSLARP